MNMNKTNIVRRLGCGCLVRQWLFGREVIDRCNGHKAFKASRVRGGFGGYRGGRRG